MSRNAKPRGRGQKGKKRGAQRRAKVQMRKKGYERSSPSYLGGGRGVRAFRQRI